MILNNFVLPAGLYVKHEVLLQASRRNACMEMPHIIFITFIGKLPYRLVLSGRSLLKNVKTFLEEDIMSFSLLTFSLIPEAVRREINADDLCRIAADNDIYQIDIIAEEAARIYGVENLKAAMEKYGVRCGCVITNSPFFTKTDEVEKGLEEACRLAKALSALFLMVVPGQAGEEEAAVCASLSEEEIRGITVKYMRAAVEIAGQYGLRVGFENTPHDYKPLSSAEDCLKILEQVPYLGLIFDTGNFRVADTGCDELKAYEMLKDHIIRVHLKDVVICDEAPGERCVNGKYIRCVLSGSGVIPLHELLGRMQRDGYAGDYAIEYAAPHRDPDELSRLPEQFVIPPVDHSMVLGAYCRNLKSMLEGDYERCPSAVIPGLDKPVSRILFGTAAFPMVLGISNSWMLDFAFSRGVNTFDSARGYGGAENSLGKWIKERNNREKVVVLTKCGNVSPEGVHVDRGVIEKELAESLEALGTDYIDIYLLHRDDPNTPVSEFIDTLNRVKREGKIRIFGVSNWTDARIREANDYAKANGLEGFSVSSPYFGLARQMEDPWGGGCVAVTGPENEKARAWYEKTQFPLFAYSSLGRGMFGGRVKSTDPEGAEKFMDQFAQKGYLSAENLKRLGRAEQLAAREHCTVPGIAMRYIFGSPMNVFAVASVSKPEHLTANVKAANCPLNAEDMKWLEGG